MFAWAILLLISQKPLHEFDVSWGKIASFEGRHVAVRATEIPVVDTVYFKQPHKLRLWFIPFSSRQVLSGVRMPSAPRLPPAPGRW